MTTLRSFALALPFLALACASSAAPGLEDSTVGASEDELLRGVARGDLWPSKVMPLCFDLPRLERMPAAVRAAVRDQAELERRWRRRKDEFVAAIAKTWGAVGLLEFRAKEGPCGPGEAPVRYDTDTPTGGWAGMGKGGGGVTMDADFLGDTYAWGMDTYHTYTSAHEVGHVLGFRHEQDRADSACKVSQDFSGIGVALTAYDPESIMNYCNAQHTALTARDVRGFERAYAFLRAGDGACASVVDRQSVVVYAAAPGRTGAWWCAQHFGANLGGRWACTSVTGGVCAGDAPAGETVSCARCATP